MSIVVVGNGSSVLGHRLGSLIDEFDDVVRFNNFAISAYEEFVGTKTTIWFRNSGFGIHDRSETVFKEVILQRIDFPRACTNLALFSQFPSVDADTIQEIRRYVDAPGLDLSTGIQALGYLVRRYGYLIIHGFDVFDPPVLYFEPTKIVSLTHSVNERRYIDSLKARGLVTELADYAQQPFVRTGPPLVD